MPTIEVSDETYELIKDQLQDGDEVVEVDSLDDLVGEKLFIRTVTYHLVGEVAKRVGNFLQLDKATWVADTGGGNGRLFDTLKKGFSSSAELEPVGQAFVSINAIVDIFIWKHKLPTKQQ